MGMCAEITVGCYKIDAYKALHTISVLYERKRCRNGVFPTVTCKYFCQTGYDGGDLKIELYNETGNKIYTTYVEGEIEIHNSHIIDIMVGSIDLNLNVFIKEHENKITLKACIVNTVYDKCEWHAPRVKEHYFYFSSDDQMPNFTLQDVLSHPTFTRLIMSKTREEIEFMRDTLVTLLKCAKVLELYKSHKLKEITPERRASEGFFTHFLQCVYAHDSTVDGPDTCVCCLVSTQCEDIIKFLNERF